MHQGQVKNYIRMKYFCNFGIRFLKDSRLEYYLSDKKDNMNQRDLVQRSWSMVWGGPHISDPSYLCISHTC